MYAGRITETTNVPDPWCCLSIRFVLVDEMTYARRYQAAAFNSLVVDHIIAKVLRPKNWRWFDVFRTVSQAFGSVCEIAQVGKLARRRRAQQLLDVGQARHQKRRRFVQRLRAA